MNKEQHEFLAVRFFQGKTLLPVTLCCSFFLRTNDHNNDNNDPNKVVAVDVVRSSRMVDRWADRTQGRNTVQIVQKTAKIKQRISPLKKIVH